MAGRQVGSVFIRVRPDATDFRRETDREVRRQLAGYSAEVPVAPDMDHSRLRAERDSAQRYLDRNELEMEINADFDRRLAGMEDSFRRMSESVTRTNTAVQDLQRDMRNMRDLEIGIDHSQLNELVERIDSMESQIQLDTADARRSWEAFKQEVEAEALDVDIEASPDRSSVLSAAAQMQALAPDIRARMRLSAASVAATMAQMQAVGRRLRFDADIVPRVDMTALARAEAVLLAASRKRVARLAREWGHDRIWRSWIAGGSRSLAGLGDMDAAMERMDSVIRQLDVHATQAAGKMALIGSAASLATDLVAGLFVSIADATRVVGLAAAAPSALLGAFAALHTHRSIWQDFGRALEGDEDALERIPENGQRAVEAIDALSQAVNRSIQDGFWEVMNDEIVRFTETVGPALERGMSRTAEVYGETMSSMLDLAQEWAETGQLDAGFSNINRMLEGVGGGVVEFFDAFVTVGLRASRMMPRLGHEFEQLGVATNSYLQWASDNGMLERWIEGGINALSQLIDVGGSTVGIFQGLTGAFREGGAWGLSDMVDGMQAASDFLNSARFQFQGGNIFRGAIQGADELWRGFGRVGDTLLDSHQWLHDLLLLSSEVGREGLFRTADFLGHERFQQGQIDLMQGAYDALEGYLQPATEHFANIVGWISSLGGEILREIAPGVETLMRIFSDGLDTLGPSIIALVEPMTQFIDNLGHTVHNTVNGLIAPALKALIDGFLALPGPIQQFLALAMAMSRWMPAVGAGFTRMWTGMATGLARANRDMDNMVRGVRNLDAPMRRSQASTLLLTDRQKQLRESFRDNARAIPGAVGAMARLSDQYRRTGPLIQAQGIAPLSRFGRELNQATANTRNHQRVATAAWREVGRNVSTFTERAREAGTRGGAALARLVTPGSRVERQMGRTAASMENFRRTAVMTADYMGGAALFSRQLTQASNFARTLDGQVRPALRRTVTSMQSLNSIMAAGQNEGYRPRHAATPTPMVIPAPDTRNFTRAMDDMRNRASRAWTTIADGARTAGRNSAAAFQGVGTAIAAQGRVAASGFTAAMMPAISAVRTGLTGLAGLGRSMLGLIGGVPGLLLIGGLSAISQVRNRAAESRREVEGLRRALESGGNAAFREEIRELEGMAEVLADLNDAGADISGFLDDMVAGNTSRDVNDVAQAVKDLETATYDAGVGAQQVRDRLEETNPLARELFDTLFAQDMNTRDIHDWAGDVGGRIEEVADHAVEARREFEAMREAIGRPATDSEVWMTEGFKQLNQDMMDLGENYYEASENAADFAQAVSAANDATSTSEARVASMSGAMRHLRGDYEAFDDTGVEVWNRQEALTRTLTEAQQSQAEGLGSLEAANGRLATSSDQMSQTQVLGLQAVTEAHELAMAAGIEAYDAEMRASGDMVKAQEAAAAAYQLSVEGAEDQASAIRQAAEAAGMAESDIQLLEASLQELGNVDDFEFIVQMSGLEPQDVAAIYDALHTLEGELDNFSAQEWQAFLSANPDQAYGVVNGFVDEVEANFVAHQFMTQLGADGEDAMFEIAQATGKMQEYEAGNYGAVLTAALEDDEVTERFPGLLDMVEEWEQYKEASLGLDADGAEATLNTINEAMLRVERAVLMTISMEDDDAAARIAEIDSELDSVDGRTATGHLTVDDYEAQLRLEASGQSLDTFDGRQAQAILDVLDNASPEIREALLEALAFGELTPEALLSVIDEASPAIDSAQEAKDKFSYEPASTTIDVDDQATPKTETARRFIEAMNESKGTGHLDAIDDITPKTVEAISAMGMIPAEKSTAINGIDNASAIISDIKTIVDMMPTSTSLEILAKDGASHVISGIRNLLASVPKMTAVAMSVTDGISAPVKMAIGALASIPRSTRVTVTANNSQAVSAARQTTSALRSVPTNTRVSIMANAGQAISAANSTTSALRSIPTSISSYVRVSSNAWGVASSVRAALNSIPRSRTVTIHTRRTSSSSSENGNIFSSVTPNGLSQAFAQGGFSENHKAMIAQPQTPYRIWAEPETGGEAYIPLAASKRSRSLAIWEETGRRLGAYANGGINERGNSGGGNERRGPTFNITNNYPVAEPASKTAQKAAEFVGSGMDWS